MIHSLMMRNMASSLGFLPGQLLPVITTAPLRYKVFTVPKRNGERRLLAQPAREVKAMQYWILGHLRPLLPVHSAVTAYEVGTSIRENARRHAAGNFLLKMDFSNFFPSILATDFKQHLIRHGAASFSEAEHDMLSRILFWAPNRAPPLRLCIGAPTSPFISNTILYDFDSEVAAACAEIDVTYTRYADDLAFSTLRRNVLYQIPDMVREKLAGLIYPRLQVNGRKTIHASKRTLRKITGIVITPKGVLSVGRDRKRLVRAMYHRASLGQLDAKQLEVLRGQIAYIVSIEPDFEERLISSIGGNVRPW